MQIVAWWFVPVRQSRVDLIFLFGFMYAGFGVQSPYLPQLLTTRSVSPESIGFIVAAGTLVRLAVTPPLAHVADARHATRILLAAACAASSCIALLYATPAAGWMLVFVALAQAAALAPLAPFADAIALSASGRERFSYGFVRGVGSAAFVAATIAGGALAGAFGWVATAVGQAALLAIATPAAAKAPEPATRRESARGSWRALLKIREFRIAMGVASLVLGSHALHDGFAVIYWTRMGAPPAASGILWAEGVAAETLSFMLFAPWLLRRIGPRGGLLVATGAAILRWCVMAQTGAASVMAFSEPLHGLTFALLHLSCMSLIARRVPTSLATSAQALYGAVAVGGASLIVTSLSGVLFAHFAGGAFYFMAALCIPALPLIWSLRENAGDKEEN